MDNYRLKVKLGEFEFDADGPHDVVQAQFEAFQDLIAKIHAAQAQPRDQQAKQPDKPLIAEPSSEQNGGASVAQTPPKNDPASTDSMLSKIMKVENRIVSLTASPQSVEDAALLLIYGQRMMRNNETVTGGEVVDGLEATGGLDIGRSERLFEKIARSGDIIMIGERRGKRYRLTNAGINKARQIAASMIALVSF